MKRKDFHAISEVFVALFTDTSDVHEVEFLIFPQLSLKPLH